MRVPYNPKVFRNKAIPGRSIPGAPEAENSGLEFERGDMGMNATKRLAGFAMIATLILMAGGGLSAYAQTPAAGQDTAAAKGPKYTQAEYNAEQACAAEKVPAAVIKCADDFVAKYPNSDLLVYIYPLYFSAYTQLKNPQKVIEYSDKLVALGDKAEPGVRYQALYARALSCASLNIKDTDPTAKDSATKCRDAAQLGLKTIDELKKPDTVPAEDFAKQKLQPMILFNYTAGNASMTLKDYPAAVTFFKAVLALNPDDPIAYYNIGKAYQAMTPPQQMDAFWYFSKAVTAKGATEAQSRQIKTYLRKLLTNYQGGNVCESLTDAELNELLQLAGSSADRPASYSLASAADLAAAQKDMTIASVVADLKAGGDKGKLTWLASCGLEFPEVPSKVIEVVPGSDFILLKVAFVTSDAEFDAATTPNMDVKIVGQPEAARVEKDSAVHFTGTLSSYEPDPAFFLHWEKAKVKEEDIPKEKTVPKKPVRKPAARKPSR
jgi:tetratricopeptide (TPR) repeat protein